MESCIYLLNHLLESAILNGCSHFDCNQIYDKLPPIFFLLMHNTLSTEIHDGLTQTCHLAIKYIIITVLQLNMAKKTFIAVKLNASSIGHLQTNPSVQAYSLVV